MPVGLHAARLSLHTPDCFGVASIYHYLCLQSTDNARSHDQSRDRAEIKLQKSDITHVQQLTTGLRAVGRYTVASLVAVTSGSRQT